jgi:hypothetical protein
MIGRDDLLALRERWRLLCADPGRDDVAAALAAPFLRDLDEAAAALRAEASAGARAEAVGRLLRAGLAAQLMRERAPYRPGPYAEELRERLGGAPRAGDGGADGEGSGRSKDGEGSGGEEGGAGDESGADGRPEAEARPDPSDPFRAWHLSDLARSTPEPEREALVDAATDAFAAIALAPIDPGNDLGPFTAMAHVMNERQVRRAVDICETMGGADWGLELSYARAYLYSRLAALGRVAEAEALLPRIADPPVRAFARGQVLGHRVAHGLPWTFEAEHSTPRELSEYLSGLAHAFEDAGRPPPEALLRESIECARAQPEGERRLTAILPLASAWCDLGPFAAWLSALEGCGGGATHVNLLFEVAARRAREPEAAGAVRDALDRAARLGANPARWLDDLYEAREAASLADAIALFVDAMTYAARGPRSWLPQDLHYTHELEGYLRWIGGDGALAASLRALDEVEALLA